MEGPPKKTEHPHLRVIEGGKKDNVETSANVDRTSLERELEAMSQPPETDEFIFKKEGEKDDEE